jgi:hypothetical protein
MAPGPNAVEVWREVGGDRAIALQHVAHTAEMVVRHQGTPQCPVTRDPTLCPLGSPGDQLVDALGPSQVRRQNLRGKRLGLVRRATVEHPRLRDFDRTEPGQDRPLRRIAVADHLAMTGRVHQVLTTVDPTAHFGLDGFGQQALGAAPQHRRQHIRRRRGGVPNGSTLVFTWPSAK